MYLEAGMRDQTKIDANGKNAKGFCIFSRLGTLVDCSDVHDVPEHVLQGCEICCMFSKRLRGLSLCEVGKYLPFMAAPIE